MLRSAGWSAEIETFLIDDCQTRPANAGIAAARSFCRIVLMVLCFTTCNSSNVSRANDPLSEPSDQPLHVSGEVVHRWKMGTADISYLRGDCQLRHDDKEFFADSVLVVVDGSPGHFDVKLVLDGARNGSTALAEQPLAAGMTLRDVPIIVAPHYRGSTSVPESWWPLIGMVSPNRPVPNRLPKVDMAPDSSISQVQFTEPILNADGLPQNGYPIQFEPPIIQSPDFAGPQVSGMAPQAPLSNAPFGGRPVNPLPSTISPVDPEAAGTLQFFLNGGTRSVEFQPRSAVSPPQVEITNRVDTNESVVVARGGVTVLVRDVTAQLPTGEILPLGTVTLSADRIVAWMPLISDMLRGTRSLSDSQGEIYLEGDIVFRQGDRLIYAEAMIYNATLQTATVLDAEAITSIPQYQGVVRVKAAAIQQLGPDRFMASNAAITSSRLGVPTYWLQSQQLELTQRPVVITDPVSGLPIPDTEPFVSSGGNFVYFGGVPVLYWPRFSTPLSSPSFFLKGARVANDDIFGTQVMLEWDLFQLLGFNNPPAGVESTLLTDYLSERGPAIGGRTTYNRPSLFGIAGPVTGTYDSYLMYDGGQDTLGFLRTGLEPEETVRGRSVLRHRHYLPYGWEFVGEFGLQSDRHFLEQFFEQEWDQNKDLETGIRLRRYAGSNMLDLHANAQVNDYFMETEQLPTLDHYLLGSSLLGDRLTWSMHNEVGYQKLNVAERSSNPIIDAQLASQLPGEFGREGLVTRTRQELSMPVDAGPFKFSPFAIGEASHYGEAVDGDPLTRLWGGGGLRANLPLSRIDPTVQSSLLNVRGLAHKIDLSAEYFYADSDTELEDLPYYDPLDDNAQEQFRRFFINNLFGGALPDQFDPRSYAYRQGIQRYVASPSDVIVDDLQQMRLGFNNRFQTKRGLPGRERIVDLFRLDLQTILFPDAEQNFDETIGPTTYDSQFNLGDRVTLLSDGYIDFIDKGLRSISAGVRTSRPGSGDFYIGLLSLEGPISSTVLRTTLDQRLNEKWIISAGTTYDFNSIGTIGNTVGLTRIGESFLVRVGLTHDAGRDNTSFGFLVEPRFLPVRTLGYLGGQFVPPPGIEGLE